MISVRTWPQSKISAAAEPLTLRISSHISQMITKIVPVSMRITISCTIKRGIPFWVCRKVNGNQENKMIRASQTRESHFRTNTSTRRKNNSKRTRLWHSRSRIWLGKNILSVFIMFLFSHQFVSLLVLETVLWNNDIQEDFHQTCQGTHQFLHSLGQSSFFLAMEQYSMFFPMPWPSNIPCSYTVLGHFSY